MDDESFDVVERMRDNLRRFPDKKALVFVKKVSGKDVGYGHVTYGELDVYSSFFAGHLKKKGIKKGDKVVVLVPFSPMLYVTIFALVKLGAVIVFFDPWMGLKNIESVCTLSKPKGFVGIKKAGFLRMYSKTLRSIPVYVSIKKTGLDGFEGLQSESYSYFSDVNYDPNSLLFVRFTTGSTGEPKGVERSYAYMGNLLKATYSFFKIMDDDVDLTTYPLNIFFDILMGATGVLPPVSYGRMNGVDPETVVREIEDLGVTSASGSPFFWRKIVDYCEKEDIILDGLRFVYTGGGPLPFDLVFSLKRVVPNAKRFLLYGSAEAFPISWVSMDELELSKSKIVEEGRGLCVGMKHPDIHVRVIKPVNGLVSPENLERVTLKQGEVGEIVVSGPQVASGYYGDKGDLFKQNKIVDDGKVWHRTGDLGYLDEYGRVWLTGRLKNIVVLDNKILSSLMVEYVFDELDEVEKTAFVAGDDRGDGKPFLVVETKKGVNKLELDKKINSICKSKGFPEMKIVYVKKIPLDRRHHTKVDYDALKRILF